MPWITEFLPDIGTVNGSNKSFTLTETPIFVLACAFPFAFLVRVGSQPRSMEYEITGVTLTLGLAPATDTRPWIIYWHED